MSSANASTQEDSGVELNKQEKLMIVDYQACLDILRHEDGRKSHLFTLFFVMQGTLFGFYGLVVENSKQGDWWIIGIGIFLSLLWYLVMERMRGFIDLRYVQGEQLEKKLGVIRSIQNELDLRNRGVVQILDSEVKLRFHQKIFSISKHLENLIPVITAIVWLALFVVFRGL